MTGIRRGDSAARRLGGLGVVLLLVQGGLPGHASAQDTVRVGITYQPGVRPGIVILPAPGLDSVKAIVERDLDFSDRFEVIKLTQPPPGEGTGPSGQALNYAFYRTLGGSFAVEFLPAAGGATELRLHDLAAERVRNDLIVTLDPAGVGEGRMSIHNLSDEIVRLITGQNGIASTRILYLNNDDKRVWRSDSDGAHQVPVSPAGVEAMSPAWHPDGTRLVYTQFNRDGTKPVVVQQLAGGQRTIVPGTGGAQFITPAFSPDGRQLMFARMGEDGTSLYAVNAQNLCCLERVTGGRFAENFSPAYSPDGRRVVFVSTRAGGQQIYSMAADGADQSLLIPFDFGSTGNSNAPDWSPDGAAIAFHREVGGVPQIFVFDLARRSLKQLTSLSRNEDPSWAPDGRHIVFVSHRTGRRQLFVVDLETNRVRQIMTPATARLPAWSRSLGSAQ
jgi:TolB protein